ncbi:hypothetical protein DPMN_130550 [Dreissena polymorpha]|uniref:Uncharacterized protein n=1 Tax=Dreissena polymorpha TaxID=45954 RepID=A0A9D4H7Y3_DREPO|nr:hypothetical protein DPMN_130550 [Dreissena polymorpha]
MWQQGPVDNAGTASLVLEVHAARARGEGLSRQGNQADSLSFSWKQASEVAKPVEGTGSLSTWTDVVQKRKKARKAPETQDAAPATSPPGDQTPSPVTTEMPLVETKEMEVSEGTAKRKLEKEEDFYPMPRNRVVCGVEQVESGGIDTSEMLSPDSIYDGMLATQSPHRM